MVQTRSSWFVNWTSGVADNDMHPVPGCQLEMKQLAYLVLSSDCAFYENAEHTPYAEGRGSVLGVDDHPLSTSGELSHKH
jgi:hypothetical protein